MKPVVVVAPANEKGRIEVTVDELQKMLNDAYEAGKADGNTKIEYVPYYPNTITTPFTCDWTKQTYDHTITTQDCGKACHTYCT